MLVTKQELLDRVTGLLGGRVAEELFIGEIGTGAYSDFQQATSLAGQADLRAPLQARDFPFHYLCGERDAKFRAIAQALAADTHIIHHAGHNAHRDNPAAVIACLAQILAS